MLNVFTFFFAEFPNCVGAIDGTQIPINCPWINPKQYLDHHKRHSISVLAVANHCGAISYLSARWPGSVHNSHMLQETYLQDVLDRNLLGEYYLLGDQGYKLQRNLLTPYPKSQAVTPPTIYYNECLSKTRVKIECVFGMLKNKFPCLVNPSHYQPEEVCDIIKSCIFLWNFGLLSGDNKGYDPDAYIVNEKEELDAQLTPTMSGVTRREIVTEYLVKN